MEPAPTSGSASLAGARGHGPARVAVVTRAMYPFHGYGGLERHVADLVRHLRRAGLAVTVITRPPRKDAPVPAGPTSTGQAGDLPGDVSYEWVPYRTFPGAGRRGTTVIDRSTAYILFGRRAGRRAADLVSRGQVDLVYGLGASVLGYARARRRQANRPAAPLVFNPQGLEEFGATDSRYGGARLKRLAYLPLQRAVRACARAADRVIATDRALLPIVERHLQVPAGRLAVVPNGIDLERCDRLAGVPDGAALRRREGIADDEHVLLSVGRLEASKGFHVLAAALSSLTHLRWRWVLVGDGPYRTSLQAAIVRHGLHPRTSLPGLVDEPVLHAWYEAATLFVHPTLYEGSSLVTLEAMAHRRPVIATRAGGIPDKVIDGETGWLVSPGDVEGLGHAIAEALRDPGRLLTMGFGGRRLVEERFAWPSVAARLVALFADACRP